MKRILYPFLALLLFANTTHAQINAVTEDGKEVVLNNDGTWKYKNETTPSYYTTRDTVVETKSKEATFLVKGKHVNYGIWYNPKKWKLKADDDGTVKEYTFMLRGQDAYAMVIPERIKLPEENLVAIALKHAQSIDPNSHITREETRNVNGQIVKYVELSGTAEGIQFTYLAYYYTGEAGAIQLVTYTSDNLLEQNRKEMLKFLNGLVILND